MELTKILQEAQELQHKLENIQKELDSKEITITNDEKSVTIKITGNGKITALTLTENIKNTPTEKLQKEILTTIQKAIDAVRKENQEAMQEMNSLLALPTLDEIKALAQKAPKNANA